MLKRLNGRHLSIIRRLLVGQPPVEIERELGVSQSRISVLLKDPLFSAKMEEMEERVMSAFVETRASAMEILQEASPDAARMVVDAFRVGKIHDKEVGVGKMLDSAFDVLDRTGNKGVEKSIVGSIDLGKLIAEAYTEKHGDSAYATPKGEKTDSSFDVLDVTPTDED